MVTPVLPYPPPKVVSAELAIFKVPAVVVMSPPLTATSPAVVIFPAAPVIDQLFPDRSFNPLDNAVTISASDRSMAVVISPAADWILIPAGRASFTSRFSINSSCAGGVGLLPSRSDSLVNDPDPDAVCTSKLASVAVSDNVNPISLPSVVTMVLPPVYALCRVIEAAEHLVKLLLESTHRVSPVVVCKPFSIMVESASVLKVMSVVPAGVKIADRLALKSPVTVNPLFTVVNPEAAPIFKVDTPVKIFTVPAVEVMSPPLTARSPLVVTSPVNNEVESMVKVPLA